MAFKIYRNRKTKHPSISLKSGDKEFWHNLEVTHSPRKNDRYIEVDELNPNKVGKSYIRKYCRRDKHKFKGFYYSKYKVSKKSEKKIKSYLSHRNKKR